VCLRRFALVGKAQSIPELAGRGRIHAEQHKVFWQPNS
jgi:hypothetical protein